MSYKELCECQITQIEKLKEELAETLRKFHQTAKESFELKKLLEKWRCDAKQYHDLAFDRGHKLTDLEIQIKELKDRIEKIRTLLWQEDEPTPEWYEVELRATFEELFPDPKYPKKLDKKEGEL